MNPELSRLASDLRAAGRITGPLRVAVDLGAIAIRDAWRANARDTAGAHGVHYPNSITHEVTYSGVSVAAEIGPDSSMPQGGMGRGFEYGSVNQPPHLDGARAVAATESVAVAQIDAAVTASLKAHGL